MITVIQPPKTRLSIAKKRGEGYTG
jgi:hypothetical protein